jgi:hypothetical protein
MVYNTWLCYRLRSRSLLSITTCSHGKEIEDDVSEKVSEKVEAVTEEAFEGSLESFLKQIGWC